MERHVLNFTDEDNYSIEHPAGCHYSVERDGGAVFEWYSCVVADLVHDEGLYAFSGSFPSAPGRYVIEVWSREDSTPNGTEFESGLAVRERIGGVSGGSFGGAGSEQDGVVMAPGSPSFCSECRHHHEGCELVAPPGVQPGFPDGEWLCRWCVSSDYDHDPARGVYIPDYLLRGLVDAIHNLAEAGSAQAREVYLRAALSKVEALSLHARNTGELPSEWRGV